MSTSRRREIAAWGGLLAAIALIAASVLLPGWLDWETMTRRDDETQWPPLHGYWEVKTGPGTWPAVLLAVFAVWWALTASVRLPWRWLLVATYVVALAWLIALAYVDGPAGIERSLGSPYEYLETARVTDDIGAMLSGYIERIPMGAKDNWVTHVAGHPPGALLFFVGLVRLGLGDDWTAGITVAALAATIPAAVMVTLHALGTESMARRAAPFLVFTPAAVFLAVSADAVFTAVGAWGLAALALAAVSVGTTRMVGWSVLAGLLLGGCVMMSYGLPLLGLLALAVLVVARSWRALPIAIVAALVVVVGFAIAGFAWWEAYPVLRERYYDGLASERPFSYWVWGNLGALLICAGPLLGAGLAACFIRWPPVDDPPVDGAPAAEARDSRDDRRAVVWLVAGAAAAIAVADLSGMSKSEVERIWLPFVPWLTISLALLPHSWHRWGLALQVTCALLVQHLLYTSW